MDKSTAPESSKASEQKEESNERTFYYFPETKTLLYLETKLPEFLRQTWEILIRDQAEKAGKPKESFIVPDGPSLRHILEDVKDLQNLTPAQHLAKSISEPHTGPDLPFYLIDPIDAYKAQAIENDRQMALNMQNEENSRTEAAQVEAKDNSKDTSGDDHGETFDPREYEAQISKYCEDNPTLFAWNMTAQQLQDQADDKGKAVQGDWHIPSLSKELVSDLNKNIIKYFAPDSTDADALGYFRDIEGKHSAGLVRHAIFFDGSSWNNVLPEKGEGRLTLKVNRHMTTINLIAMKPAPEIIAIDKTGKPEEMTEPVHSAADQKGQSNNDIDIELKSDEARQVSVHLNWQAVQKIRITPVGKELEAYPASLQQEIASAPQFIRDFIATAEADGWTPYLIDLELLVKEVIGEFVYIGRPAWAEPFVEALMADRLKMIVAATPDIIKQLQTVGTIFSYHRSTVNDRNKVILSDPLRRWHNNPGRMVYNEAKLVADGDNEGYGYYSHYTFHGIDEYCTVSAIMLLQELRDQQRNISAYGEQVIEATFITVPGFEDKMYQVFLPMPEMEEAEVRLTAGTSLKMVLKNFDRPKFEKEGWTLTISEPMAYAPYDMIPAIARRKNVYNETTDAQGNKVITKTPDTQAVISSSSSNVSERAFSEFVRTAPTMRIKVEIQDSDKVHRQNFMAIDRLVKPPKNEPWTDWQASATSILTGHQSNELPASNGLAHIIEERGRFWEDASFNPEQKAAFQQMTEAPGRIAIVNGPPGTGKSHIYKHGIIRQAIRCSQHSLTVVTVNTNEGVNKHASDIEAIIKQGQAAGEVAKNVYLVRLHATATEKAIERSHAEKTKPKRFAPHVLYHPEGIEDAVSDLDDITIALTQILKSSTENLYEGIRDKRVRLLENSAGMVMLKVSGIIHDDNLSDPDEGRWQDFRGDYRRYATGQKFTPEAKKLFTDRSTELFQHVLKNASVIVATNTGMCTPRALRPISEAVNIIVQDEAMTMKEVDSLPLFAAPMPNLKLLLLVGDLFQLGPRAQVTDPVRAAFHKQFAISLPSRLARYGHPVIYLYEQNRMNEDICNMLSGIAYGGKLRSAPSTLVAKRWRSQKARTISSIIKKKASGSPPKEKRSVLLIDFKKENTVKLGANDSRYCEIFIQWIAEHIQVFLTEFYNDKKTTFAVLTFYAAELNILLTVKATMAQICPELRPALDRLHVGTVDSSQGNEFNCVFLLLSVSTTGGFINDPRRLTVALSRAQDLQVILYSSQKMYAAKGVKTIRDALDAAESVNVDCNSLLRLSRFYTPEDNRGAMVSTAFAREMDTEVTNAVEATYTFNVPHDTVARLEAQRADAEASDTDAAEAEDDTYSEMSIDEAEDTLPTADTTADAPADAPANTTADTVADTNTDTPADNPADITTDIPADTPAAGGPGEEMKVDTATPAAASIDDLDWGPRPPKPASTEWIPNHENDLPY